MIIVESTFLNSKVLTLDNIVKPFFLNFRNSFKLMVFTKHSAITTIIRINLSLHRWLFLYNLLINCTFNMEALITSFVIALQTDPSLFAQANVAIHQKPLSDYFILYFRITIIIIINHYLILLIILEVYLRYPVHTNYMDPLPILHPSQNSS
jgi:hypothetical protein